MLLFNLLIHYELLAIIVSPYYILFINFYFIRVFFQELCAMFQPCKFYHFGKKTKTLPQKYIVPQRNDRIKSDIKLSDCALFKRVLLFFKCKIFSFESHKIHLLALLGPFTDPNDRFSYPVVSFKDKIPTLSYTLSLKMVPLSGGASPYRPL